MKWIKGLGLVLLTLYVLACMSLYFIQENIVFNPDPLPESYRFDAGKELEIEVEPGYTLNTLWLREPNSKGLLIYLHGNKGNLRRCLYQARVMSGNGYDILMPDYRGYGKSEGQYVSEEQLLQDMQKVYDWAKTKYEESQIVLVGYSLGTGMASYLAAQNQPAQLALVAPYLSFVDLKNRMFPYVPDFLLKYPLRNHRFLEAVECPVTLFHGTEDRVIPYDSSIQLQQIDPQKIRLITLEQESHRGAIFNNRFRRTMQDLLE